MHLGSGGFHSRSPDSELCEQLALANPTNPFFTKAYIQSTAAAGNEVIVLGCGDGADRDAACVGYVRRGRLRTWMTIPSVPRNAPASFWDGLLEFTRAQRITDIDIATFASPGAVIPRLPGEVARIDRIEFAWRLPDKDLFASLGKSHRERVKKAGKAGMTVRRGATEAQVDAHVALHVNSMDRRRSRGESVPDQFERDNCARFLATGAAELFQAVRDGVVCSSLLVLRSARGAYSESSGNSADGMKVGASHFLRYEVARVLQAEGIDVFFLGGVKPAETGLWSYKAGFGAEQIPMQTVIAYSGGAVRRALSDLNELRHAGRGDLIERLRSAAGRERTTSPT